MPSDQPDVLFNVKADTNVVADGVVLLRYYFHFYWDNLSDVWPYPKKIIAYIFPKNKEMFLQVENNISQCDQKTHCQCHHI